MSPKHETVWVRGMDRAKPQTKQLLPPVGGTVAKMPAKQRKAVLDALEIYRAQMKDAYLELSDLIEAAEQLQAEK